jgi:hypothetical protein
MKMRKVILSNMTTMNGFMEGPDMDISWHHVDGEFFAEANATLDSADERVCQDRFLQNPGQGRMEEHPADQKGYRGRTQQAETATQPGKDMVIFGSSDLAASFLELGLLDEIRIFVNPVILGEGKPMFRGLKEKVELQLVNNRTFGNGNVMLTYHPIKKAAA